MNKIQFVLFMFASLFTIAGCSGLGERVDSEFDARQEQLDKMKTMREDSNLPSIWIPHKIVEPITQVKTEKELKLESELYTLRGFYDEINNLSSKIAEITNIPIIVEQGITNQAELAGAAATTATTSGIAGITSSPTSNSIKMEFSYNGDLKGLLNLAASRFNIYWEWINNGEKIRFFKTKTQVYRFNALAGTKTYRSVIGKSSEASENSSSQFESGVSFSDLDMWESVKESVEAMLSSSGKVVASPATSLFVVTDTPIILREVEQYFKTVNETALKQVSINITVLSVDTSESENYGINWNMVYSSISEGVAGSLTSNIASPAGASQFGLSIIDGGNFNGSDLFISALRQQAEISSVQHYNAITTNNQPAPISVTTTERILGQSSVALDGGQSVSTQELEDFTVGFNLSVIPNIINGEEMLMQFALDMSRELDSKTVQSGNTTYQLPKKESRSINREVKIKSGNTLVITGFEQANLSSRKSGVAKWLGFLGNAVQNEDGRNKVVVLVEPVIMD